MAKNSILAIDDMFFGLRHKADGEITTVIAALVKVRNNISLTYNSDHFTCIRDVQTAACLSQTA